jgi:hypothetical protein
MFYPKVEKWIQSNEVGAKNVLTFDYLERRLFAKVEHAYGGVKFNSFKNWKFNEYFLQKTTIMEVSFYSFIQVIVVKIGLGGRKEDAMNARDRKASNRTLRMRQID